MAQDTAEVGLLEEVQEAWDAALEVSALREVLRARGAVGVLSLAGVKPLDEWDPYSAERDGRTWRGTLSDDGRTVGDAIRPGWVHMGATRSDFILGVWQVVY